MLYDQPQEPTNVQVKTRVVVAGNLPADDLARMKEVHYGTSVECGDCVQKRPNLKSSATVETNLNDFNVGATRGKIVTSNLQRLLGWLEKLEGVGSKPGMEVYRHHIRPLDRSVPERSNSKASMYNHEILTFPAPYRYLGAIKLFHEKGCNKPADVRASLDPLTVHQPGTIELEVGHASRGGIDEIGPDSEYIGQMITSHLGRLNLNILQTI